MIPLEAGDLRQARVAAIVGDARAAVAAAAEGPEMAALLAAAIAPALAHALTPAVWPVIDLPMGVVDGLGGPPELGQRLAVASLLFFASADVIDDAQDGDLSTEESGLLREWPSAITAGMALLFLAQQVALEASPPTSRGAIAAAFCQAGLAMSLGQRQDLAQRGEPSSLVTESDYMACARRKSGASMALFATLPALALGSPHHVVEALRTFGQLLGLAIQLASDMADVVEPQSRDRRNRQLTLPVLAAWGRLEAFERPLLAASWAGDKAAPPLPFLLKKTGALSYCRARLRVLQCEALAALNDTSPEAPSPIPETLKASLTALTIALGDAGYSSLV